jgi:hypothetical protein
MQRLNSYPGSKRNTKSGITWIVRLSLILTLCLSLPAAVNAMEYGATGPYSVSVDEFQNAAVVFPRDAGGAVPVVFLSPGIGTSSYIAYASLLKHIASQGVAAVIGFFGNGQTNSQRYSTLWNGYVTAVRRYSTQFDMTRVGFIGHSYGGGAAATMAYKGVMQEGWGSAGVCLYIMAPYLAEEVTDTQLASLPSYANMIIQSFNDDTVAVPHIATDLYSVLSRAIPFAGRAFYYTEGDHTVPTNRSVDNMDTLAIQKPLDALMDYSFKLYRPEQGRTFALTTSGDHYLTTVVKDPNGDSGDDDPPVINDPPSTGGGTFSGGWLYRYWLRRWSNRY